MLRFASLVNVLRIFISHCQIKNVGYFILFNFWLLIREIKETEIFIYCDFYQNNIVMTLLLIIIWWVMFDEREFLSEICGH